CAGKITLVVERVGNAVEGTRFAPTIAGLRRDLARLLAKGDRGLGIAEIAYRATLCLASARHQQTSALLLRIVRQFCSEIGLTLEIGQRARGRDFLHINA